MLWEDQQAPRSSSWELPVTKNTLTELDLGNLVNHVGLCHDINFNPDVLVRPKLYGERARKKKEKAYRFFNSLLEQLLEFLVDPDGFYEMYGHSNDWCLPTLLNEFKGIIQTLVSQPWRELLDERLDVKHLMREFYHGLMDLDGLSHSLLGVLKLHCARERDEWVDEIHEELSRGNGENDMGKLVKGLWSLFNLLEAMKYDLANCQIRRFRHLLVQHTVPFEQQFFIKQDPTVIDAAKLWYGQERERAVRVYQNSPLPYQREFGAMAVFFSSLVRVVLPSVYTQTIPVHFRLDRDRICKLRSDIYDSTCLEICMCKLEDLEHHASTTQLKGDEPTGSCQSSTEFNLNTLPGLHPSGSTQPGLPDPAGCRPKMVTLYNDLLALVETAPPATLLGQKWQRLAPEIALHILRYVNAPCSLAELEGQLATGFGDVHGGIFRKVALRIHRRLYAKLAERVNAYKSISCNDLFSAATDGPITEQRQRFCGSGSLRGRREEAVVEDIATRMAHLGVLHWRVWASLAYLGDIDSELPTANYPG